MSDDIMKAALNEARRLLAPPVAKAREPIWPALAAAAFFAFSALTFAYASLLAPPVETHTPPAIQASDVLRGVN
jgi:hypothetical protein